MHSQSVALIFGATVCTHHAIRANHTEIRCTRASHSSAMQLGLQALPAKILRVLWQGANPARAQSTALYWPTFECWCRGVRLTEMPRFTQATPRGPGV